MSGCVEIDSKFGEVELTKYWVAVLVGLCLLLIGLPASAQTALSQVVDLGDGYSISIPADWTVTPRQGYFVLDSPDLLSVFVMSPKIIDNLGWNLSTRSAHADLVVAFDAIIEVWSVKQAAPNVDNITEAMFGGRKALTYVNTSGDPDEEHILLSLSDGKLGYLMVLARKGQLRTSRDLINAIVASYDNTEAAAAQTPEALPVAGTWTITFSDVTSLDCKDKKELPVATKGLYGLLTHTHTLSLTGADSFHFGDGDFKRIDRTNRFSWVFRFSADVLGVEQFYLQSPTLMTGQLHQITLSGPECITTTNLRVTHP